MNEGENVVEFIREIKRLEKVNIVTRKENDLLRTKKISGNYDKAGVVMVPWENVPESSKYFLRKKIRGKVVNANKYI